MRDIRYEKIVGKGGKTRGGSAISFLSVVGVVITLFGYGKLYGIPRQTTFTNLDVKTEQVESGLEATVIDGVGWHDDVSIVVDNEQNPHIVYPTADLTLKMAEVHNRRWRAINFGVGPISIDSDNSIVIDNQGYFHVSAQEGGADENLLYFTNKDDWKPHTVEWRGSVGLENDIAVDRNGKIHISHWEWKSAYRDYGNLLYSTNRSGDWQTFIVDDRTVRSQTNIAVDDEGHVYILYNRGQLIVLDNDEWIRETIPSGINNVHEMIIDPNNTLHAVSEMNLTYSTSADGWQPHLISPYNTRYLNKKWFDDPSIAVDPEGHIHIAVVVSDESSFTDHSSLLYYNSHLLYYTNKFGEWKEFLIDRGLACHRGQIAVDNEGKVHIAYSEDVFDGLHLDDYDYRRVVKYVKFDPSELFLPLKIVTGLCYGPYREGQNPSLGIHPSKRNIKEDLLFLSKLTPYIRTYGIDDVLFDVPELCYDNGLRVFAGVWLSNDPQANQNAVDDALRLAREQYHTLEAFVIGNEAISRGDVTVSEVVGYMNQVEDKLLELDRTRYYSPQNRPFVTTAEPWHIWMQNPELVEAAGIIMAHVHPYWEGIQVSEAASYVAQRYDELNAMTSKEIVISEVGWPTGGEIRGQAVPSHFNQTLFLLDFIELAQQKRIPYLWFEFADEPWKAQSGYQVEQYWGLVDKDRNPKYSLNAVLPEGFR